MDIRWNALELYITLFVVYLRTFYFSSFLVRPVSMESGWLIIRLSMAAASTITTSSPGKLGGGGAKSTARRQTGAGQVMQLQGGAGLSKNGRQQLQILAQPEQQHRARYQTEGSRGAVKDRSGNSFPIVRLLGYDKPAVLEVFIGTDVGRVAPHMFYQACKVSGKNSTPCIEKKVEGTMIIELDLRPDQEMMVTCDCVGILKERNVDVEHRFPDQSSQRSKKKSTRCRMVFRATITNDDGSTEVLQVCSQPIICSELERRVKKGEDVLMVNCSCSATTGCTGDLQEESDQLSRDGWL